MSSVRGSAFGVSPHIGARLVGAPRRGIGGSNNPHLKGKGAYAGYDYAYDPMIADEIIKGTWDGSMQNLQAALGPSNRSASQPGTTGSVSTLQNEIVQGETPRTSVDYVLMAAYDQRNSQQLFSIMPVIQTGIEALAGFKVEEVIFENQLPETLPELVPPHYMDFYSVSYAAKGARYGQAVQAQADEIFSKGGQKKWMLKLIALADNFRLLSELIIISSLLDAKNMYRDNLIAFGTGEPDIASLKKRMNEYTGAKLTTEILSKNQLFGFAHRRHAPNWVLPWVKKLGALNGVNFQYCIMPEGLISLLSCDERNLDYSQVGPIAEKNANNMEGPLRRLFSKNGFEIVEEKVRRVRNAEQNRIHLLTSPCILGCGYVLTNEPYFNLVKKESAFFSQNIVPSTVSGGRSDGGKTNNLMATYNGIGALNALFTLNFENGEIEGQSFEEIVQSCVAFDHTGYLDENSYNGMLSSLKSFARQLNIVYTEGEDFVPDPFVVYTAGRYRTIGMFGNMSNRVAGKSGKYFKLAARMAASRLSNMVCLKDLKNISNMLRLMQQNARWQDVDHKLGSLIRRGAMHIALAQSRNKLDEITHCGILDPYLISTKGVHPVDQNSDTKFFWKRSGTAWAAVANTRDNESLNSFIFNATGDWDTRTILPGYSTISHMRLLALFAHAYTNQDTTLKKQMMIAYRGMESLDKYTAACRDLFSIDFRPGDKNSNEVNNFYFNEHNLPAFQRRHIQKNTSSSSNPSTNFMTRQELCDLSFQQCVVDHRRSELMMTYATTAGLVSATNAGATANGRGRLGAAGAGEGIKSANEWNSNSKTGTRLNDQTSKLADSFPLQVLADICDLQQTFVGGAAGTPNTFVYKKKQLKQSFYTTVLNWSRALAAAAAVGVHNRITTGRDLAPWIFAAYAVVSTKLDNGEDPPESWFKTCRQIINKRRASSNPILSAQETKIFDTVESFKSDEEQLKALMNAMNQRGGFGTMIGNEYYAKPPRPIATCLSIDKETISILSDSILYSTGMADKHQNTFGLSNGAGNYSAYLDTSDNQTRAVPWFYRNTAGSHHKDNEWSSKHWSHDMDTEDRYGRDSDRNTAGSHHYGSKKRGSMYSGGGYHKRGKGGAGMFEHTVPPSTLIRSTFSDSSAATLAFRSHDFRTTPNKYFREREADLSISEIQNWEYAVAFRLLMGAVPNVDTITSLHVNGVPPPMTFIIMDPMIRFRMSSMIFCTRGGPGSAAEKQALYWTLAQTSLAMDMHIRTLSLSATVWLTPVVPPKNVLVIPNAAFESYLGGGNGTLVKTITGSSNLLYSNNNHNYSNKPGEHEWDPERPSECTACRFVTAGGPDMRQKDIGDTWSIYGSNTYPGLAQSAGIPIPQSIVKSMGTNKMSYPSALLFNWKTRYFKLNVGKSSEQLNPSSVLSAQKYTPGTSSGTFGGWISLGNQWATDPISGVSAGVRRYVGKGPLGKLDRDCDKIFRGQPGYLDNPLQEERRQIAFISPN